MSERQFMILIDPDHLLDPARKAPPSPEQYTLAVRRVVLNIAETQTGQIVLKTLRLWNKFVRISPTPLVPGMCMGADAVQGEIKDWQFNTVGRRFLQMFGVNVSAIRAVIHFEPTMWASGGACHKKHSDKLVSDFTPSLEEVLFHELVHAVRWVSDTLKLGEHATFGLSHYDNKEEFIAVVVTNIFQSELNKALRQGHTGFKTLDDQLKNSFEFYRSSTLTYDYMEHFCRTNPHFSKRLCKVNVPFNPVHAFYHDRKRCRDMSLSPHAYVRDGAAVLKTLTPWAQNVWKSVLLIP